MNTYSVQYDYCREYNVCDCHETEGNCTLATSKETSDQDLKKTCVLNSSKVHCGEVQTWRTYLRHQGSARSFAVVRETACMIVQCQCQQNLGRQVVPSILIIFASRILLWKQEMLECWQTGTPGVVFSVTSSASPKGSCLAIPKPSTHAASGCRCFVPSLPIETHFLQVKTSC